MKYALYYSMVIDGEKMPGFVYETTNPVELHQMIRYEIRRGSVDMFWVKVLKDGSIARKVEVR